MIKSTRRRAIQASLKLDKPHLFCVRGTLKKHYWYCATSMRDLQCFTTMYGAFQEWLHFTRPSATHLAED